MKTFATQSGKRLTLGTLLGKGGEGAVYNLVEVPDLAVKIYNDGKAAERKEKIEAMTAAGIARTSNFVAYPLEIVRSGDSRFAGFTMKKVSGFKTVHDLYGPGSRKTEFPSAETRFLIRSAYNLASAVASVHRSGCIIGDINHSGILVSNQALVTLIDSDSFQFKNASKIFRCRVGVAEYTPSELQGKSFDTTDRTSNHDNFGLAVLLFQLLFLGRHPYAGRYLGNGDMDIKRAIAERRFAYSSKRNETQMEPPPFVPSLEDFGDEIRNAFERAFSRSAELIGGRPSAPEWVSMVDRLQSNLAVCSIDKAHHYHKSRPQCPWCKLEHSMGRSIFPAQLAPSTTSTINMGALIAQISRIQGPPIPPRPESIMPIMTGIRISPAAKAVRSKKYLGMVAGIAVVSFGLFIAAVATGLLGLIIAGVGAAYLFNAQSQSGVLDAELRSRRQKWILTSASWTKYAGPEEFELRKAHFLHLASTHAGLPQKERDRLADLERKKRDLQMKRYLESHLIDRAKITAIGPGRKTTLASYGIETAYDAKMKRITNIPGFGPAMQDNLRKWSRSVESKFIFNGSMPTDPRAIQEVKNEIAKHRDELERDISRGPAELQRLLDDAARLIATPPAELVDAYRQLKQAECDCGQ